MVNSRGSLGPFWWKLWWSPESTARTQRETRALRTHTRKAPRTLIQIVSEIHCDRAPNKLFSSIDHVAQTATHNHAPTVGVSAWTRSCACSHTTKKVFNLVVHSYLWSHLSTGAHASNLNTMTPNWVCVGCKDKLLAVQISEGDRVKLSLTLIYCTQQVSSSSNSCWWNSELRFSVPGKATP